MSNLQKRKKMVQDHIAKVLESVEAGKYGSFAEPVRNQGVKQAFWDVALGNREAADYKNLFPYAWARAGEVYRRRHVAIINDACNANGISFDEYMAWVAVPINKLLAWAEQSPNIIYEAAKMCSNEQIIAAHIKAANIGGGAK